MQVLFLSRDPPGIGKRTPGRRSALVDLYHAVAYADVGLYIPRRIRRRVQLFPEHRHIDAQRGRVVVPASAPDIAGDIVVSEHFPGILRQQAQQPVLNGRELQFFAVERGISRGIVYRQLSVRVYRAVRRGAPGHHVQPPHRRPQAGQQLLHRERLGKIIVRAGVERLDLVRVVASGADDDDGHVGPASDPADDVDPVHVRQAEIQEDDVRVVRGRHHDRLGTVCRRQAAVIMCFQRGDDQIPDRDVVLYHQDCRFIHRSAPP